VSNLERSGSRLPRRAREQRAFRLVVAGGVFGIVAAVTFVLAIAGVGGLGIPILAAILAVICVWLFRRTVGG
jgi:hypothetical protein